MTKQLKLPIEIATKNMKDNLEKCILEILPRLTEEQKTRYLGKLMSIELMAGGNMGILSNFEPLAVFYNSLNPEVKKYVGFCLDTCHIFASGYDISTYESAKIVFDKWDLLIGIDKVNVIHFNGSLAPLNSCVDRHARLGGPYDQISQVTTSGIEYITGIANKNSIPIIFEVGEQENFIQASLVKKF